MVFSSLFRAKGQSAIEYLMTYGWMLLVVAVTGGAIFATVGDQGADSTSGFTGSDVQVDEFGVTSNGDLQLELRDATGQGSTVTAVNVSDDGTGKYVYKEFSSNNVIDVGESLILNLPNVSEAEGSNSLDVEILYDSGGLENMSVSGAISGSLEVDGTIDVTDTNDGSGNENSNLWSIGETRNYTYNGPSESDSKYDVELDAGEYELELHGANGSDAVLGDANGRGGTGGYIMGNFTSSDGDIMEIWVASSNTGSVYEAGWGRKNGGNGTAYISVTDTYSGAGAGSAAAALEGTDLAIAGGGGGGAGYQDDSLRDIQNSGGGGGGARGGLGGNASGASGSNIDGEDGEGIGFGGDGGNASYGNYAEDGEDGGFEGAGIDNIVEAQIGGSSKGEPGEGYVEVTYLG